MINTFVTTPFETDLEFSPYETDIVLQLKDQNKLDELFRLIRAGEREN